MKKLIYLSACLSATVIAESKALPPVIDSSTVSGSTQYAGTTMPVNSAMYELLARMEQMQIEVQELRGIVEEQSQVIQELKTRQGNMYADLDERMQNLSLLEKPLPQEVMPEIAATPTVVPEVIEPETVAEPEITDKHLYQEAYETLRNGHYKQAIAAFKDILAKFPSGEYADNSQYWLGEAYKVNQDIKSAQAAFAKVLDKYPNSPKVPDSLLKLGYIEFERNNMAKARDYFTQVVVNYPKTTAAHLAEKKLIMIDQM